MEMQQLRYFVLLCEELNFTRAAKRCGISQPSLTNAIKALEKELEGPLFHRTRSIRLTERGEAVRPLIEKILRTAEKARQAAMRCNGTHVALPSEPGIETKR